MGGGGVISTLTLVLPHLHCPCRAALPHPSRADGGLLLSCLKELLRKHTSYLTHLRHIPEKA